MMSSEEDVTVDSFGVLKKSKRSRQRVDAGEPRNSYSSIPNFSSRPNLLGSGIYGTLFAPNHQPFATSGAYFNPGFGPTKMLNELLSRRVKTITDSSAEAMMTIDVAGNDVSAISSSAYDCLNSQSPVSRVANTLNGGGGSPPVGEMEQHKLWNILQGVGRKKDLYALEQKLRVAGNNIDLSADCANDSNALTNNINNNNNNNNVNNNNTTSNSTNTSSTRNTNITTNTSTFNNNNNTNSINNNINNNNAKKPIKNNNNNEEEKINPENGCAEDNIEIRSCENSKESLTNGDVDDMEMVDADERNNLSREHNEVSPSSVNSDYNNLEKVNRDNDTSESERSLSSPESVSNKDDVEETGKECASLQKIEQELKRARVENIVSGMRASPLPVPVNGCKKRKLYHPQQHDNSMAERYANLNDIVDPSDDEDENQCSAEIRKKVVEKNALKNQLRSVQEQMAELQQRYVQLCTGSIQQDSLDTLEQEEMNSDVDQDDDRSVSTPEKAGLLTPTPTPTTTPIAKDIPAFPPPVTTPAAQTTASPSISKLLNPKFPPQNVVMPPMNPLHPNFNGALSFLQHQMFQEQQQQQQQHLQGHVPSHPHHHHPTHPHPALSNAAAMYLGLGVSQKLFMEQEARMAKEAALAAVAVAAEHQQLCNQNAPSQQHSQPAQHHSSSHGGHSQSHTNVSAKGSCSPVRSKNEQPPSNSQINQTSHSTTSQLSRSNEFSDRLHMMTKNNTNATPNSFDLEGLADALKSEITATLSNLIDTIVTRFLQQKRVSRSSDATLTAEQLNKDLLLASQLLDRKSPRTKIIDRGTCAPSADKNTSLNYSSNAAGYTTPTKSTSSHCNTTSTSQPNYSHQENSVNSLSRTSVNSNLFSSSKLNSTTINNAAAAALYSSMNSLSNSHMNPFCLADMRGETAAPEQNEALSLVVAPKKKRHKVTDTRITPRTVSRILAQDGFGCPPSSLMDTSGKFGGVMPSTNGTSESPPPRPFPVPHTAPMLPVTLPTSVAIPNPSLHESQVFSPYSPFYGQHHVPPHMQSSSPPGIGDQLRDSPPLPHHSTLFHPALIAAAQQQQQQQHHQQQQQQQHQHQQQHQQQHHQRASSSPDFMNVRPSSGLGGDSLGPGSECNSMEFEGMTPTNYSSTLSPMHLRKAKLMFFWVRYPTSAVLKMYFPDIRFNKNNTAQLVKWFSNFREFYYIQMEKYARAAIAENIKNADDLHVSVDSDIYRVLNLHYNRNNHIEVPSNFRNVVEQTLKEFFKAIQGGKDQDQSWKKPIYKVIGRLDDPVPDYFKTPNFLEQLE